MTTMAKIVTTVPILHLLAIGGAFVSFVSSPSLLGGLALILATYVLPLLGFRIHDYFYPTLPGTYDLSGKTYNPWWGSYQFQWAFITFPTFEKLLMAYPPLYLTWLRLWGAEVGRNVMITPKFEVLDRSLVKIGDNTTFGYSVLITSHYVARRDNRPVLVVAKADIGSGCFVGAYTKIAPGAKIHNNIKLPYNSEIWPEEEVKTNPKPTRKDQHP